MATRWRTVMQRSQTPVPTLIVATGHPTKMWPLMWNEVLFPGFDDGVVPMDSQLGRGWNSLAPRSNYLLIDQRRLVIDRANGGRWPILFSSAKALGYYIDQIDPPSFLPFLTPAAAAANPYLTPTGMHLDVISLGTIPQNSAGLPNTYTFLQASANHCFVSEFGSGPPDEWENIDSRINCSAQSEAAESYEYKEAGFYFPLSVNEESRAVFDYKVYVPGPDGVPLVSPSMQDAVEGTTVTRWVGKMRHGIIRWQRTYYRLKGWQCLDYFDYIHKYAVRR